MKWPQDCYQYFQPVLTIWKYLGFFTYKLLKNNTINLEKSKRCYASVIISLGNVAYYHYYYAHLKFDSLINVVKISVTYVHQVGVIYYFLKNASQLEACLGNCVQIQDKWGLFQANPPFEALSRFFFKLLVPRLSMILFEFARDWQRYGFNSFTTVFYFHWIFTLTTEASLVHFLVLLQESYRRISASELSPQVLGVYALVTTTAHRVHGCFEQMLLLQMTANFTYITINLFLSLTSEYNTDVISLRNYTFYLFLDWVSVPLKSFSEFLIAKSYDDLIQKERDARLEIFHKDGLLKTRQVQDYFRFRICGFFEINLNYLHLMVSVVSTYVLYLVQFHKIKN